MSSQVSNSVLVRLLLLHVDQAVMLTPKQQQTIMEVSQAKMHRQARMSDACTSGVSVDNAGLLCSGRVVASCSIAVLIMNAQTSACAFDVMSFGP